ncbi:MAG: DNA polymerase III subunit gamma/tau [Candidatus Eremiobacteraeota bacterium]|nr:DNA polymerase III subunit gamma/tau [Candidatus Eremiobacteraeota bacterium]
MSLYRTWRPKTFADLVGQDVVVRSLSSAIESGKTSHAYLFSGPRGSGKTSAAKIMARCLNCEHGPTPSPDNSCQACLAMIDGTAFDVLEIDAASNNGVDDIRALRDAVRHPPASMRFKVYIIDEAHMISGPGANAFLKTLEEPPPYAVFILATTEPQKLPITILSRCQRYSFKRIAVPVMIERMRIIAAAESISIDDAALAAIAYRADGGLRDALTMLEQAAAFSDGSIDGATLERAFGASGREFAHALVDATVARDAAGALRAVEEASDAGTDMGVLIRAVIAEFRNLLVARVDPALLARDLAPEDAARAAQSAGDVPQATIVRALRLLSDSAALARSSGNPRLELESALLRFILAAGDPTLDGLAARVAALEGGAPVAPARVASARVAPAPAPPPEPEPPERDVATNVEADSPEHAPAVSALIAGESPTLQKVKAAWQSVRAKVESERQPLRMPLARAVLDSLDGNVLTVTLPTMFVEILRPHTALLEGAIAEVLGASLTVRLAAEVASKPAANPRGKGDAPAPRLPATDADDPDALFNYANERIR